MKQYIQALMAALIAVAISQAAAAGDAPTTKNETAAQQMDEYATGWNAEVFGGATPFQSGAFHAGAATLNTADRVNGVAGAKFGYVWNPGWNLSAVGAESVAVLPSLDVEGFWTGYQAGSQFKANGSAGGAAVDYMTDQDIYVLSVDPTVKFQIGRFRPYVGAGVGAAYLTIDGGHVSTGAASLPLNGASNDFAFAFQGLAGLETFIDKNWSLDIGYKYLGLLNPTFGAQSAGGAPVATGFPNVYGEHILTAGVHFYF